MPTDAVSASRFGSVKAAPCPRAGLRAGRQALARVGLGLRRGASGRDERDGEDGRERGGPHPPETGGGTCCHAGSSSRGWARDRAAAALPQACGPAVRVNIAGAADAGQLRDRTLGREEGPDVPGTPVLSSWPLSAGALLLAGCSSSGAAQALDPDVVHLQPGAPGEPGRGAHRGAAGGRLPGLPFTEADVAFMRDMQVHHAQALAMTALVEERTDQEDLRLFVRRMDISQEGRARAARPPPRRARGREAARRRRGGGAHGTAGRGRRRHERRTATTPTCRACSATTTWPPSRRRPATTSSGCSSWA